MLLWQLLTNQIPLSGKTGKTGSGYQMMGATTRGERPQIPNDETSETGDSPKGWIELIKECWQQEPLSRPAMSLVVEKLKKMNT
jgi:hypothetical protein